MAETRVCVTAMINGVPVGAQVDVLLCTTNGCPFDRTRVVPLDHSAVTHGPLPLGGGGSAQPATTYGGVINTVGMPFTSTRGLGAVGWACPPCEHRTVAPT